MDINKIESVKLKRTLKAGGKIVGVAGEVFVPPIPSSILDEVKAGASTVEVNMKGGVPASVKEPAKSNVESLLQKNRDLELEVSQLKEQIVSVPDGTDDELKQKIEELELNTKDLLQKNLELEESIVAIKEENDALKEQINALEKGKDSEPNPDSNNKPEKDSESKKTSRKTGKRSAK